MKLNIAFVISLITLLIGLFFNKQYIVWPLTILIASIIDLFTRKWFVSDKLGSNMTASVLLKALLVTISFYGMVGQIICLVLLYKWFF